MSDHNQWIRKVGLFLFAGDTGMDLSEFRIRFSVCGADTESPNNCAIRIYNLSQTTVKRITASGEGEFKQIVLNAGYTAGNYGVIFKGTIKQYRIGRESPTTSYLDILAADGDIGYNQGLINTSLASGATPKQAIQAAVDAMKKSDPTIGVDFGSLTVDAQHTPSIRGQVLFGMARARLRNVVTHLDAGWSFSDGNVVITDNTGYNDGEAVDINVGTGLVGMPEQTEGGIRFVCLLNSRIRIGNIVQLNNAEIIQLMQQNPDAGPIPYNQWSGFQFNAAISEDGKYRAFVVEHTGDTRGNDWHTHVTGLAVNQSAPPNNSVERT